MSKIDDSLGFMYIAEQTSPDDYDIKNIDVVNKNGVFFVRFESCLHSFDVINRNQRQYKGDNIWECIQSERIQSYLADNAWYGEQDHPTQVTTEGKLTPERIQAIWMPNRSHKILNPRIKSNLLVADIETASGTEAGVGFGKEIIQGLKPAFSCRAIAGLKLVDGKPTVIVRKIITYDWVLYPSHKEAHITSSPKGVIKKLGTITESVKDTIKRKSEDVLIPLKEILEYVSNKDVNTQMIMESFDLSQEDLIGFDSTYSHAAIQCDNNVIYTKISPQTAKEVKSFLASF